MRVRSEGSKWKWLLWPELEFYVNSSLSSASQKCKTYSNLAKLTVSPLRGLVLYSSDTEDWRVWFFYRILREWLPWWELRFHQGLFKAVKFLELIFTASNFHYFEPRLRTVLLECMREKVLLNDSTFTLTTADSRGIGWNTQREECRKLLTVWVDWGWLG